MLRSIRLPSWALLSTLALLAVFWAWAPSAFAAAANPAEAFVQENIDKGYVILNNASLPADQRRAQFRDFMLGLTDTKRIGMFTLGQYANAASKADIDTFISAFTDYAVAVYESRLSKYKGQTLKVTGSDQRSADDVVVNADVINPTAPPSAPTIKAAFRVRKTSDGRPIITDMQVEGIWLALSQRSDFTGFLQQHGGKLAALTDNLRMQTQTVRGDSANGAGTKKS